MGIKIYSGKSLEERLEVCKDALDYRAKRCGEAKPQTHLFFICTGAFGKRLKPDDRVKQLFDKQRATLSLGYRPIRSC